MILSVDPGATSGWALVEGGRVIDWGTLKLARMDSGTELAAVVAKAGHLHGVNTMVIEGPFPPARDRKTGDQIAGWRTSYGQGVARGRWEQAARAELMDVIEINPATWLCATVGKRSRGAGIALYRARAKAATGIDVPADASAAIVMGLYYTTEQRRKGA